MNWPSRSSCRTPRPRLGRYYEYDSLRRNRQLWRHQAAPGWRSRHSSGREQHRLVDYLWPPTMAMPHSFVAEGSRRFPRDQEFTIEANRYAVRTINKANQILQSVEYVDPKKGIIMDESTSKWMMLKLLLWCAPTISGTIGAESW